MHSEVSVNEMIEDNDAVGTQTLSFPSLYKQVTQEY